MKVKFLICLTILALVVSACAGNGPASETTLNPQKYPNSASPVQINAPVIETPALVKLDMLNELDGWGVTATQIVRTNDGGLTWYNVTPPDVTETGYGVQYLVRDANTAWVQIPDFNSFPNSGFLYRTRDGGMNWSKSTTPFSGGDLEFLDEDNGWMLADLGVGAGSNAVAVYRTTDGGANWTLAYTNDPNQANAGDALPLGGLKSGIAPLNMQTAFVYGVIYAPGTAYLFRTDDGGETWAQVTSPPLPEGAENAELSIDQLAFLTPNDGLMTMRVTSQESNLAVYTSNDAGDTWSLTPTLIPIGGSADFLSATEAVIYNGEQFYVTSDAARTWNTISPDIVFGDTFAQMDFVNLSSGWVLTLDPTTNQSSLYRTTDGGSTWLPVLP
ncbi:MAG TPA: hypothetical protein VFR47_23645 [Anaerolineales bacterium]|nr:hypothetical protein [Anaerolineales bacterium]